MNNYTNKFSCWYIEQRDYLSGPPVKDQIYFHKQTEQILMRQLSQELPVLGKFKKNVTVQFFYPHALNMIYFYLNLSLKGVF